MFLSFFYPKHQLLPFFKCKRVVNSKRCVKVSAPTTHFFYQSRLPCTCTSFRYLTLARNIFLWMHTKLVKCTSQSPTRKQKCNKLISSTNYKDLKIITLLRDLKCNKQNSFKFRLQTIFSLFIKFSSKVIQDRLKKAMEDDKLKPTNLTHLVLPTFSDT